MTSKSSDCSELACSSYRRPNKTDNVCYFVRYVIYGTRAVVSRLIQHSASPRAVSASRPHPSCHKSRNALVAHIIYYLLYTLILAYRNSTAVFCEHALSILRARGYVVYSRLYFSCEGWLLKAGDNGERYFKFYNFCKNAFRSPHYCYMYLFTAVVELSLEDLGEVLVELLQVRSKWYDVGILLKVPVDTLDGIEARYDDPKDRLREVLKPWLKKAAKSQPTWRTLVEMLRNGLVDEPRIADQLEAKYCPAPDREQGKSSYPCD